jgi:hypothetical protein
VRRSGRRRARAGPEGTGFRGGQGGDDTAKLWEGCRAGFHGKGGDLAVDAKAAATAGTRDGHHERGRAGAGRAGRRTSRGRT